MDHDHTSVRTPMQPALDADPRGLRIALCVPDLLPLRQVVRGQPADATYIVQAYIAAGLRARGHRLTFVAPLNLTETVCTGDLERPTVALRTWSRSRCFDLASRNAWRIQRGLGVPYLNVFSNYRRLDACRQCLPGHDLVYERNGLYNVAAAKACERLGLPYVVFFEADQIAEHGFMGRPLTGLLRWRARALLRYNLGAAACVICVSEAGKRHLMTNWNVPAEKIVVFPNAVDVERFRPDPEGRAQVRAALGLNANPMIMFVGNFFPWHDVATLLEAFGRVLAGYPHARLVLVGEGAERQAMMRRAAERGLGRAVQFTGVVPHADVPRYVAAADIAVVPYPRMHHELWLSPLKLFEYMASGVAVVASRLGQLTDVLQDGRNGLLVPPGDARAMAAAVARLLDDATLRARLGRQAREDAVRKHSWEQYVARLERVCRAVIAGQPVSHI